jgi:predicted metalloprotease with PDZ domain
MAYEPGRNTEPIIDTTTAAPYLYATGGDYPNIRRTAGDFYTEGELMWLDADTIIRQETHNQKSLDTYCHIFAGGVSSPRVVTYTRADIEHYLHEVVPSYNWHGFFQQWVYSIAPLPPTDEIDRAGYKLVWNDKPNKYVSAFEGTGKFIESWFDVGITIGDDGEIGDVRENSAAWNAGLAPHMKILAVNDREFSPDVWQRAVKATSSRIAPMDLLVDQGGNFMDIYVHYTGGVRIPHLVRVPGTHDMLADIMRPHAK